MTEDNVREFLRTLAGALRASGLYPAGHPMLEEHLERLTSAADRVLEHEISFAVFVHEDSYFIETRLIPRESLTLQWMIREWQQRGIHSILVSSGARRDDLAVLVRHLAGGGPPPEGAVAINAASLVLPDADDADAGDLHRAYAAGLDLAREIGRGLARGAVPSLGGAIETIEGLVGAVLADPDSALLLSTVHSHDEYTFFHMVNVCLLSVAGGASIGLDRDHLLVLGMGGLLHDMGKVAIPPEILNRAGPLSEQDWRHVRRHPMDGAGMILRSWDRISPLTAIVAYEHHRRIDGGGYPLTPLHPEPIVLSRIVTVADTYDALTSRRSYRRAEPRDQALEVLLSGAGTHFDPRVVQAFIRLLGLYPPGATVELDDGSVGVVVRRNEARLELPVVRVVRDPEGRAEAPYEVDLAAVGRSIRRALWGSEAIPAAELV